MENGNPPYPSSPTGGVKPMNIEGYFENERRRLSGLYTDAEREWRRKWLKDQELSPNEPRVVPELERELCNPFRRFYRKPWDLICAKLTPVMGAEKAANFRWVTSKVLLMIAGVYLSYYYLKYNSNDWTRHGGWMMRVSKREVVPGDPLYPQPSDRHYPSDYADHGFKSRNVFLDKKH